MFKKALTSAAMATALLSGAAYAGGPDMPECLHCFKPFIGVNYSYGYYDWSWNTPTQWDVPKSFNGVNFDFGAKYGPYFGLAFGGTHYFEKTSSVTVPGILGGTYDFNKSADLFYMEARGYWPLGMGNWDIIGAIGGAWGDSDFEIAQTPIRSVENSFVAWRFGLGLDYYFTPNWGLQALFHYMPVGSRNFTISPLAGATRSNLWGVWTVNVGVYYMFN